MWLNKMMMQGMYVTVDHLLLGGFASVLFHHLHNFIGMHNFSFHETIMMQ